MLGTLLHAGLAWNGLVVFCELNHNSVGAGREDVPSGHTDRPTDRLR